QEQDRRIAILRRTKSAGNRRSASNIGSNRLERVESRKSLALSGTEARETVGIRRAGEIRPINHGLLCCFANPGDNDSLDYSATYGGYSMPRKEILDRIQKYIQPFRITKGAGFQLKNYDPGDTSGLKLGKSEAFELLKKGSEWLAQEQDMLYAQDRWSLLLVFQAMDAAGKDSTIKHVMSG